MRNRDFLFITFFVVLCFVGCISEEQDIMARCIGIIDGETIKVRLENGTEETVRLLCVDVPEEDNDLVKLRFSSAIENEVVRLEFDREFGKRDQNGNLLSYVWFESEASWRNINVDLVSSGSAFYDTSLGEGIHAEVFGMAEEISPIMTMNGTRFHKFSVDRVVSRQVFDACPELLSKALSGLPEVGVRISISVNNSLYTTELELRGKRRVEAELIQYGIPVSDGTAQCYLRIWMSSNESEYYISVTRDLYDPLSRQYINATVWEGEYRQNFRRNIEDLEGLADFIDDYLRANPNLNAR